MSSKNKKSAVKNEMVAYIKKQQELRREHERLEQEELKKQQEEFDRQLLLEKQKQEEQEKKKKEAFLKKQLNKTPQLTKAQREKQESNAKYVALLKSQGNMQLSTLSKNTVPTEEENKKPYEIYTLRSPIVVVMGHVDTGKTSLLDKIRGTNVQSGEAGGITQQIGSTFVPVDHIKEQTKILDKVLFWKQLTYNLPGLLLIDTAGHEVFINLRTKGIAMCDIAIVVVDMFHVMKQQTIECIKSLQEKKIPYIIALNKVDLIYGWKSENTAIQTSLKNQNTNVVDLFQTNVKHAIAEFATQEVNTCLYWENNDYNTYTSIVPVSAKTGEGIPDLLMLLTQLTQKMMKEKLTVSTEVKCNVIEVNVVNGYGTTIDVILANGSLHVNDKIILCGTNGPIKTTIKSLLVPPALKDMRIKTEYTAVKEVNASLGVKIVANDLDNAMSGSQLFVYDDTLNIENLEKEVMTDVNSLSKFIDKTGCGVSVQTNTLGSMEALLYHLTKNNIAVSNIAIGPIRKKHVMRASVQLERNELYAIILAFNVTIDAEAKELSDELGLKIVESEVIYKLTEMYKIYEDDFKLQEQMKKKHDDLANESPIFPCELEILPKYIFHKKNPFVVGVKIIDGILKIGTPICVNTQEGIIAVGTIKTIEKNNKPCTSPKILDEVCVSIDQSSLENIPTFGRQFDETNILMSSISRKSIDLLKLYKKDEMTDRAWKLVIRLKKILNVSL